MSDGSSVFDRLYGKRKPAKERKPPSIGRVRAPAPTFNEFDEIKEEIVGEEKENKTSNRTAIKMPEPEKTEEVEEIDERLDRLQNLLKEMKS